MTGQTDITAQASLRGLSHITVARVICLASPDNGRVGRPTVMPNAKTQIGRSTTGKELFGFDDREISRTHATFEPGMKNEWRLVDLNSRNGTFVDGQRIQHHELSTGNIIRVGSTILLYQELTMDVGEVLKGSTEILIGSSLAIQRVVDSIHKVCRQDIPVLIHGETGVGKELVAKEIHRLSGREGSFVPVNCGALSPELAASELFGHAAGAFTGASTQSEGLFEAADQGTIFLDEIGELPSSLQPLLLRVLATGSIRPVGENHARPFNVRVVAATNRQLANEVRAGAFRADLFSRLSGWQIAVPPLRNRRDDILDIARFFANEEGCFATFHPDVEEALVTHDWPFNIRELEHAIQNAATKAAGESVIDLVHLPKIIIQKIEKRFSTQHALPQTPLIARIRREGTPNKNELEIAFQHFSGNVGQIAAFFGKDRKQIYRWAKTHGIDPDHFR